jgi:hypothetical protein
MPDIAPLVNALMELMTAKDTLTAKQNQPGVRGPSYGKEVQVLSAQVGLAENKVNQAVRDFQTALAAALQTKP